jgi:hypothetical protein
VEIDSRPIGRGPLTEHVGEGDAAEDEELSLQHAVALLMTALRGVGVIGRRLVGDHARREPARDEEARHRKDQQLLAQRDAQSHRYRSGQSTNEGTAAP